MAELQINVLSSKRVLVTRALEQSGPLAERLREAAAIPVIVPMVAVAPPDDLARLDAVLRGLHEYQWIFLTSQNTVRALQERAQLMDVPFAEAFAGVRIAVVGPATAHAAEAAGLVVTYVAQKHQGMALGEELVCEVKGARVLLPRSDRANHDLVEILDHAGALVTEVVAYKTRRPSEEDARALRHLLEDPVDAILFFSPSAVDHFAALSGLGAFQKLAETSVVVSVGPVTLEALRKLGVPRAIVARDTTVAAVIEALTNAFSKSGQERPAGA